MKLHSVTRRPADRLASQSSRPSFSPARRALTLVELLVVFGVISALFAITAPAMQSARESARKAQCANNLKQLAYAVHQFQSRKGYFPPAYTDADSIDLDRPKHNVIAFLLPDIEQSNLSDRYSFEFDWFESLRPTPETANHQLAQTPIDLVKCPSTPAGELDAASDYAVCTLMSPKASSARNRLIESGRITQRMRWTSMLHPFDEATKEFKRVKPHHIVDGLSRSMMLFEDAGRPAFYVAGNRVYGSGKEPISGALWADADSEFGVHDLCGDSMMNCNNGNEIYSFHQSGCNFAFGDSSVRFVSRFIDPEVFVSLFTRNAGDLTRAID